MSNEVNQKELLVYIPAGGKGERLKPFTNIIAKPLLPILIGNHGKISTILDYSLETAETLEAQSVVSTFWHDSEIKDYINRNGGNTRVITDDSFSGAPYSLVNNLKEFEKEGIQYVIYISGDTYITSSSIQSCLRKIRESEQDVVALGTSVDLIGHDILRVNRTSFEVVNTDDNQSIPIANLGIYVMKLSWLKEFVAQHKLSRTINMFHDIVFSIYKPRTRVFFVDLEDTTKSNWADLGTFPRLYSHICNFNIQDERGNVVFPGAYITPKSKVSNSIIYPRAEIDKNVILDKCFVGIDTIVNSGIFGKEQIEPMGFRGIVYRFQLEITVLSNLLNYNKSEYELEIHKN